MAAIDYLHQFERALDYIEQNLQNRITVADAAKAAAYSYSHFHRVFEAIVGETIGAYIRSRRLSKAAEELLYTDKRIIDIAFSLRFESHEAFSRAFKSLYKVSPIQYRKNGIDTVIGRKFTLDSDLLTKRQQMQLQPKILILPDMELIGIRFPVCLKKNKTRDMWTVFHQKIKDALINTSVNQYCFYEAHRDCTYDAFNLHTMTTAFIGVERKYVDKLPEGLEIKYFIGGKYACFTHVGTVSTLLETYRYIWGTWIPYNKVELSIRDDIEITTERFLGENNEKSEVDIYVPIK